MKESYLTVQDLSKNMKVSDATVRRLLKTKQIRAKKIGRQFRILTSDYLNFQQDKRLLVMPVPQQRNEAGRLDSVKSQPKNNETESE